MTASISPHTIITASGNQFNYQFPHRQMIDKKTIIHHLSRINRWGGNTEFNYSVAQHSLLVAAQIQIPRYRIYGLLHDAAEAYIGDLPTPFKHFLQLNGANILSLEREILNAVWDFFKLEKPNKTISDLIHIADQDILATEYRDIVAGRDVKSWKPTGTPINLRIKPKSTMMIECEFEEKLDEYLLMAGVK